MDRYVTPLRSLPGQAGARRVPQPLALQPPAQAVPPDDIVARALAVLEEECRLWAQRSTSRLPGAP